MRAEAGATGELPSTVESCEWSFTVEPRYGWGSAGAKQQATAGWLAALPVFEPHWQVHTEIWSCRRWIVLGSICRIPDVQILLRPTFHY